MDSIGRGWPEDKGKFNKRKDWHKESLKLKRNQRRQIRQTLYPVSCGLCTYCLQPITYQKSVLEHMLPRSRGGTDDEENLTISCKDCDVAKKDCTPLEFLYLNGIKLCL